MNSLKVWSLVIVAFVVGCFAQQGSDVNEDEVPVVVSTSIPTPTPEIATPNATTSDTLVIGPAKEGHITSVAEMQNAVATLSITEAKQLEDGLMIRTDATGQDLQTHNEVTVEEFLDCGDKVPFNFKALWEEQYKLLLGCSVDSMVIPIMGEQHCQGGHMFWWRNRDGVGEIRTIYDPEGVTEGTWRYAVDNWDGVNEDSSPEVNAPHGLHKPIRGFGLEWREQGGPNSPLSWCLDKEYGFENVGIIEYFQRGAIFRGSDIPTVYILFNDGSFKIHQ